VLFVDDDNQILRAYSRALGRDCNVLLAEDGQEAIDLLSSGSTPDAIVTELSMPQIDGAAFYTWLRRERPNLATRTVFVTAHSTTLEYKSFLRDLPNPLLLKPVNAPTLKTAIDGIITASEPRRRSPGEERRRAGEAGALGVDGDSRTGDQGSAGARGE
jgi:CheY-like chemotaxis protein